MSTWPLTLEPWKTAQRSKQQPIFAKTSLTFLFLGLITHATLFGQSSPFGQSAPPGPAAAAPAFTPQSQPAAQSSADAPSHAYTIEQAVDEALSRNLTRMADRYDLAVAEARILQARVRPNPILMVQGQYLDVLGGGFNTQTNPAGPPEFDAGLNFLIEQRGKRRARIEVAKAVRNVAETDFLGKTRALILDVENAFVDLQQARENRTVLQQSLSAFETIVKLNAARVQSGDLAEVELTRSELAALQFQNQVVQAEINEQQARVRLQSLMGRTQFDPLFEPAGPMMRSRLEMTRDQMLRRALESRPDVLSARRDALRAAADITYQRKQTIGDTGFQVQFNRQWDIGIQHGQAITLTLLQPLPFFNRNQGEIQRASQEFQQAEARVRAAEAGVIGEVEDAMVRYGGALQLLERIEQTMLDRAQRVRSITEYSYRRGESTFVEFLDSQRAYFDTTQNYNEARAQYAKSMYLIQAIVAAPAPRP